jgi:hypothetical protein
VATCPNGHPSPDGQPYCGDCGAPVAASSPATSQPTTSFQTAPSQPGGPWQGVGPPPSASWSGSTPSGKVKSHWSAPRAGWIAAAGVSLVAISALVTYLAVGRNGTHTDNQTWSGFPHTMICKVDPLGPDTSTPAERQLDRQGPLPESVRVKQLTLSHPGGDRMQLAIQFAGTVPATSQGVDDPGNPGQQTDGPGSLKYHIATVVGNERLDIDSPTRGNPWEARLVDDQAHNEAHPPRSVTSTSDTLTVAIDLAGHLGHEPFTPPFVLVNFSGQGPLTSVVIDGAQYGRSYPLIVMPTQTCYWDAASERKNEPPDAPAPSEMPSSQIAVPTNPQAPATPWMGPAAPGPAVGQFQSPTGNIACHIGRTGAACDIRDYDYSVPPSPTVTNCQFYGDRIGLDIGAPGSLACHTTSFFDQQLPTQPYDTPVTAGQVTCVVNEQTGVTCRDTSTGHFFQVSKQFYRVG